MKNIKTKFGLSTLILLMILSANSFSQTKMEACKGSGEKCEVVINYTDSEGEDKSVKISSVKTKDSAAVLIVQ